MLLEVVEELITDSLALLSIYNATDGKNWNVPWNLDTNVIQWHGVTIINGRVNKLDLSTNSLAGAISIEIGKLTNLKTLNLSTNSLTNIPEEIIILNNLQSLNLSNNSLDSLPLLIAINNTASINVSGNNLDFSSIIPNFFDGNNNPRGDNFIYNSQAALGVKDTIIEKLGNNIQFTISNDYLNNNYQWYKDGVPIQDATKKNYAINTLSYADIGHYWVTITNDIASNLTLFRDTITLSLLISEEFEKDSLALSTIYGSTNGSNWTNTWNLDYNVSTWHGVTIDNGRVTELDLSNNSLTGNIPQEIDNLTNLQSLRLDNNSLSTLPHLLSISSNASITISNNQLTFSSIVPNLLDKK